MADFTDLTAAQLRKLGELHNAYGQKLIEAALIREQIDAVMVVSGTRTDSPSIAIAPNTRRKAPAGQRLRELRQFVAQHQPITQAEIVGRTGWPRPTVSTLLRRNKEFTKDEQKRWAVRDSKDGKIR